MSKAHRTIAGLATALLAASLAACSGGGGSVATVNGQPISKASLDTKLEASPTARNLLQQLVYGKLIDQYATKHGIKVSSAEIAKREKQLKANFPAGSWSSMLKTRGLTEKDVRNALRQQIIIDKAVGTGITISNSQVAAYFSKNKAAFNKPAEVKARHILVANLATADKVEALLKQGKKFSALAKKYSIDPGSRDKGGELGYFTKNQMVAPFSKYAFSAPIGKISPPIHSPFGYHIIQVQARKPALTATLANTRSKIVTLLKQQQESPLIQPFIMGLVQKANIKINDPRFAGLFPTPAPSLPPASPAASAAPASAASAAPATAASPAPAAT